MSASDRGVQNMHPADCEADLYAPHGTAGPHPIERLRQNKGLSLRQNFSWNLIGNIVYAACQWGMLVVLAKLTNTEMVGRFALGLAITAPIILLSQFQLRGIQATDAKGEFEFGHYLALRLISTGVALLIISGIACLGGYTIETALVIAVIGLSKSIESISDVYYGLMQRHERMDLVARSRLIKGPISLIVFGCVVYISGEVLWGILGFAAVWGALLFFYDSKIAIETIEEDRLSKSNDKGLSRQMLPAFDWDNLQRIAWIALPLGIVATLASLNANIPRYILESHYGEGELGIFAGLAYIIVGGITTVTAVGQAFTPRLSIYFANREIKQYQKLLFRMVGIGLLLGGVGVLLSLLAGRQILELLYRPEYAIHTPVFVWLMVAGGLSYIASFLGYGLLAARYFKAQLPIFIIVTIATYALSEWLIPRYSLSGAAISLIAAGLIQIVGSVVVIYFVLKNAE